jgi:hypothetical protein
MSYMRKDWEVHTRSAAHPCSLVTHGWCSGKQLYDVTAWRWNVVLRQLLKTMSCTITLRYMSHGWCNGKQMYDVRACRWNVVLRQHKHACLMLTHVDKSTHGHYS